MREREREREQENESARAQERANVKKKARGNKRETRERAQGTIKKKIVREGDREMKGEI